jgi:hypothetical protein
MLKALLAGFFAVVLCTGAWARDSAPSKITPLVALIANPSAHDDELVVVRGYFSGWHFEDCGLYLSRADFDQALFENAVPVHWKGCLDPKVAGKLHGRYVEVVGVFETDDPLYQGRVGILRDVEGVRRHESRADFTERVSAGWPWWIDAAPKWVLALLFVIAVTLGAYRVALRTG